MCEVANNSTLTMTLKKPYRDSVSQNASDIVEFTRSLMRTLVFRLLLLAVIRSVAASALYRHIRRHRSAAAAAVRPSSTRHCRSMIEKIW